VDERPPSRRSESPVAAGTIPEQHSALALLMGGETASHPESVMLKDRVRRKRGSD